MNRTSERDDGVTDQGAQLSVAELLARYGDPSPGGRRHRRRAPDVEETAPQSAVGPIQSEPAPLPPRPRAPEPDLPVGLSRRAARARALAVEQGGRFDLPVVGDDDPFAGPVDEPYAWRPGGSPAPPSHPDPHSDQHSGEPRTDELPRVEPSSDDVEPVPPPAPLPPVDREPGAHRGGPPAGLAARPGGVEGPAALSVAPDAGGQEPGDARVEGWVPSVDAQLLASSVSAPSEQSDDRAVPFEDEEEAEESSSPMREWAVVAAQVGLGVVGGAVLWLAFEWLWQQIPAVALVVALVVITGLVWVVRKVRRTDDLQTTVIAVLVGLFVTVSPAALLLVTR